MQVKMPGDSRACTTTEVHTQIETLRVIDIRERLLHALRLLHHFGERGGIAFIELGHVCIGYDHYVPARVGKPIENDEGELAAENDLRLYIILESERLAENAALIFSRIGNVAVTPRSPEEIHPFGLNQPCGALPAGAAGIPAVRWLLMKSRSSLLGLNRGIRFAGTSTFAPVFGFRPVLPRRS